jgi:hypothetical protein
MLGGNNETMLAFTFAKRSSSNALVRTLNSKDDSETVLLFGISCEVKSETQYKSKV